jgi:hypothetical protein
VRELDSLKPDEIREAAAAVAAAEPQGWVTMNARLLWLVAERLGSSSRAEGTFTGSRYQWNEVTRRYEGRVKRALDALAGNGTLVKARAGEMIPGGSVKLSMREVRYYTPGAHAAARAEGEKRQAEALAEKARWERIAVRLLAADVYLRKNGSLSAEAWERLLEVTGL